VSPIRVLIADDELLVRQVLVDIVRSHPLLEVVAVAADAEEAILLAGTSKPDVALIDVRMPAGGGARVARAILECSAETRIVAFSGYDDRAIVLDMLRAGAASYLLKGSPRAEILDTIVRSARGESILSGEVAGGILDELASQMDERDLERGEDRRVIERIRHVIDRRLFDPVFQPIVDLAKGLVVGIEALSRFSAEPLQGPNRWFAEADQVGLRVELELAAARAAIDRLEDVEGGLFLSLNVSPKALPFCGVLADDIDPRRLVVEITEHAAIDDYDAVGVHLDRLRTRGVRVAVDDAGAGFASMRHTLQLSPDFVKVDISLIHGIDNDRSRQALAEGLIGFADELGAAVVAEGIETRAELEMLRELGVELGQGFFLSAPGPLPLHEARLSHLAGVG
jgi:EAL domain-containing protein (putative c-di-GMP-specific phosphodiesterase class I)/ActR/RegA family two-component response regulator